MDRSNLRLAAKLLAKAQDTQFEAEAAALAEKAYALLAEFLNQIESGVSRTGRRRERRLLQDRRSGRRLFNWKATPSRSTADPEQRYRQGDRPPDGDAGGDIDLRA
jgi:Protein of unknown function (DUF2786)